MRYCIHHTPWNRPVIFCTCAMLVGRMFCGFLTLPMSSGCVSVKRGVTAHLNLYFVYLWSHDTAVCQARRIKNMTPRRGWSVQKIKRASKRKCFRVIMLKYVIFSNIGRFICELVSLMMVFCLRSHDTPESTAVKYNAPPKLSIKFLGIQVFMIKCTNSA